MKNPFLEYFHNNGPNNDLNNIFSDYRFPYENEKLTNLQKSINIYNLKDLKDIFKYNQKDKEEDKSLLFFRAHNFTSNNETIKMDEINKDKNYFENLTNNLEDEMKCCICLNRYKEPLLCPHCHHFFCKNCLKKWFGENKNSCVYCRTLIGMNSFLDISILKTILPFIDLLKENNNNYFNNIIKNNTDKEIILCSNKIHEKSDDEKEEKEEKEEKKEKEKDKINIIKSINIIEDENIEDDDKKYFVKSHKVEADYFCFNCKKPFCSDCICINDDYSNCDHRNDHIVLSIDFLKEIRFFDLLYEKENNKTIEELQRINKEIYKGIENLNKKLDNTILFIQYIKDTYIKIIESKKLALKAIIKENEEEINNIHKKAEDIDIFLQNLKSSNDIKNAEKIKEIKDFLNFYDKSHQFPVEKDNKMVSILSFKGMFQVNHYINKIMEFDENKFDEQGYDLNKNIRLLILNEEKYKLKFDSDYYGLENFFINNKETNKDNDNINGNKKNKLKLLIIYKTNPENFNYIFDSQNEEQNKSYFIPILFNNENKHILFEEIKEEDEPYLIYSYKYHNISNYKKYYRAFVEKDNLIVNNDFEHINDGDKKVIKIKLCLQSLSID